MLRIVKTLPTILIPITIFLFCFWGGQKTLLLRRMAHHIKFFLLLLFLIKERDYSDFTWELCHLIENCCVWQTAVLGFCLVDEDFDSAIEICTDKHIATTLLMLLHQRIRNSRLGLKIHQNTSIIKTFFFFV